MTSALNSVAELLQASCIHAQADDALTAADIARLLPLVPGWRVEHGKLLRGFAFKNYHETMAFVNALAWISHREDHHPELTVTYKNCVVRYDTHSIGGAGGLSNNDFICAAKADALLKDAA